MLHRVHILKAKAQRMGILLLAAVSLGVLTVQAQHTSFTLQVVEFNKIDIRPALCSPHVSIGSFEKTSATVTGTDNESVLRWVSGGSGKKITIEGRQMPSPSSLHVIVRPVTANMSVIAPAVAVGQNVVRDLLLGGVPQSGRAEAKIMFLDTGQNRTEMATQTVLYTVLDS